MAELHQGFIYFHRQDAEALLEGIRELWSMELVWDVMAS